MNETQHHPVICIHSSNSQLDAGLHPKRCSQQGEGGYSAPLFRSCDIPPGVLCPAQWSTKMRRTWTYWNESTGGHKDDQRAGVPLLWRQAERIWDVQSGEQKFLARSYSNLTVLTEGLQVPCLIPTSNKVPPHICSCWRPPRKSRLAIQGGGSTGQQVLGGEGLRQRATAPVWRLSRESPSPKAVTSHVSGGGLHALDPQERDRRPPAPSAEE